MPATEMIVTVAMVSALTLVVIQLFRLAEAGIRHRTVRKVVERDPSAAGTLIDQLGTAQQPRGDDRLGVILVAFGLAMVGASILAGGADGWAHYGLAAALFPLIVGAALWLRHNATERARRRGDAK